MKAARSSSTPAPGTGWTFPTPRPASCSPSAAPPPTAAASRSRRYGRDDDWLVPAALLIDIPTGKLIRWFAGPRGQFFFDHYLFACDAKGGTTVWDVATGERLMSAPDVRPTCYQPASKCFLTLLPGDQFRLSSLTGSA
jgi:hypothetical protein